MIIEPMDMRTMLQVGALVCLTIALVMVYYSFARKTYPGFHHWTAGVVSVGVGAVLVSMQAKLPAFLSMMLGNMLIVAMPMLLAHGLAVFFDIERKFTALNAVTFSLFTLGFAWHTYADPSLYFRIILFCLVMALFYAEALHILIRYTKPTLDRQEWLLVALLSISIFSSLFRGAITAFNIEQLAFLSKAGWLQSLALLLTILSTVGTAYSFLILNTYRMEIDLKKATQKIKNLANVDGLTGLYNRRFFDERLMLEAKRAHRNAQPLSLLIADIDCFKLFNDTYGHQAGDACIRSVADALKKSAGRASDITARYGGEEFVLLLPNTNARGAMRVAKIAQAAIEALHIPHESSNVAATITLSIGATTTVPEIHASPIEIIKHADNALYESKRNGKNQIRTSPWT